MRQMAKASVKTLTLIKSRDIIADRLLKPCEEGDHSKCTGWAVLRKEISPIDANYFLRCTCTCHHHKKEHPQVRKKQISRKRLKKRIKKKAKRRPKGSKKSKRSRKTRRR